MDYTARLLENEGKQRVSKYERLREETRRKLARIPGLEKEQARMEGELKLVQELYNALSVKLEQARITSEVEIVQQANRFTIIEPPVVPLTRHKPNRPLFAAAGVAGGVCIGILLVFLLEFTEPRLMRTGELLRQTRLRLAGVLPKLYDYEEPRTFRLAFQPVVKGVRNLFCARRFILPPEIPVNLAAYKAFLNQLKPGESSEGEALADYIERLRSIAIRARDTYPDHDRLLWMVTSTRAGEGKSFLAANLGAVLASDLQKPVLLLDADFKTASLSKTLGCRNAPGMADILEQRASIDEAMISLPMPDLFLLPAGAVREDPEILYNSPACQRLLERLRERFCFILMESPEMLASSGGSLLAPHTDGVLFVTLLYKARRRAVEAAIQRLPAEKIIGVVFNYFEYWIPEWLYRWV